MALALCVAPSRFGGRLRYDNADWQIPKQRGTQQALSFGYTYNAANRMTAAGPDTYTFDATGDQTGRNGHWRQRRSKRRMAPCPLVGRQYLLGDRGPTRVALLTGQTAQLAQPLRVAAGDERGDEGAIVVEQLRRAGLSK